MISLALMALLTAAPVELTLPPPGDWAELPDPQPLPPTATSRLFVNKAAPDVVVRVMTESQLRLDYSPAVLKELSKRLVAEQAGRGITLKASDPRLYDVGGVSIGSFQVLEADRQSTVFYLPSEQGDRVVTILQPRGGGYDARPLVAWVQSAKGLRPPDAPGAGVSTLVLMGLVSLGTLGAVLMLMRRKAAAPSA